MSESALKGLSSSDERLKAQGVQTAQTLVDAINEALKNPQLDSGIADEFRKLLEELKKTANQYGVTLQNVAYRLGANVGQGLVGGLNSQRGAVVAAAASLANAATVSAKSELMIASPSKVFFGIGKDTAQGFIDGLSALKASAQSAMSSLLDISGLKLGKTDKDGVELLTSYISQIAKLNVTTKEQEVLIDLTAGKYSKLNAQIKEKILLAARELDNADKFKTAYASIGDAFDRLTEATSKPQTELEKINGILSNPANAEAVKKYADSVKLSVEAFKALAEIKATIADRNGADPSYLPTGRTGDGEGEGFGDGKAVKTLEELGPPPKLILDWDNFFNTFFERLDRIKETLPSIKEAIGVNLVDSLSQIGDVFARAVTQWDGTAKGFFKSVASGFAQMAQQIIAELIRIAVMKAILKLIASAAGGGGGSAGSAGGGAAASVGGFGGFASGGYTGSGLSNAVAGIVHKEEFVMPMKAVKFWGLPALEKMKNLQMPSMPQMSPSFAGSYGGNSNTYNNQRSNVFNINVSGGGNQQQNFLNAKQIQREIMTGLMKEQQRNK